MVSKILDRSSIIGVFGLGYVGLPLAILFAENQFNVVGLETDQSKIKLLRNHRSYLHQIDHSVIKNLFTNNYLQVTDDFRLTKELDILIFCLPTPLGEHRDPDLSFILNTLDRVIPFLKKGQTLIIESTTYPGTTDELLLPLLEREGFTIGEDFFLVYSPEREDPGNEDFSIKTIPKVVSGISDQCKDIAEILYKEVINQIVPVSSTKTAEMAKLLENIHRCVNIGLVNEIKPLADKLNLDIYEVIKAASTKPFGFSPYYPGPGLGGHCIPIDPFYLTWKAKEFDIRTKFIELAAEINSSMPYYVVNKTAEALNNNSQSIKDSKILILGLSYKKNIDDVRESPSIEILSLLHSKGAIISYSDPFFPTFPNLRKYTFNLKSVDITKAALLSFDCVVLATDHDAFDFKLIQDNSRLIIDPRGRFIPSNKIYRA